MRHNRGASIGFRTIYRIKLIILEGLSVWADHPGNRQGIAECKLQPLKWADFDNNDGDGDDIRIISLIMKMMIYIMKIKTIHDVIDKGRRLRRYK